MTAHQIIQALIDSKRNEPYGNEASYQLGYLIEVTAWLANHSESVMDDLKALLEHQQSKQAKRDN